MQYGLMLVLMLVSLSAAGEIYKWTDEKGVIHYSDAKPAGDAATPEPKIEQVELTPITIMEDGTVNKENNETVKLADQVLEKLESFASGLDFSDSTPATGNSDKVTIYTTARCGACKKAKSWLRDKGVQYTEYDVERSRDAAIRMRRLGGGEGVPFAVINGDAITGFRPQAYEAALKR